MKYDFSYNGQTIEYEIIRKKVKNINIRVKPNGDVVVSCNELVDNKKIELEMLKRVQWLLDSIEKYKMNIIEFAESNLKLVDGESFLLFGKVLRIMNVPSDSFSVSFDNNYLYINRIDQRGIKQKFVNWYYEYILKQFEIMLQQAFEKFRKYDIEKPVLMIKKMKTRWGTCNIDKKIITLNVQLAKVDPFLSEYVICHELTHLRYRNHSRDFYSFLTSMVPDWKQREKILNNIFINEIGGK